MKKSIFRKPGLLLIFVRLCICGYSQTPGVLNGILQQGHAQLVTKVAVDKEHGFIVTGDIIGEVKFWDYHTGLLINTVESKGAIGDIKITPDGRQMITCNEDMHTTSLWRLSDFTFHPLKDLSFVRRVELKPGSNVFACYQERGKIEFVDLTTEKVVDSIKLFSKDTAIDDGPITFTDDGKLMAVRGETWIRAGKDSHMAATILIFDCKTKRLVHTLSGASFYSQSLSFSADGKCMASTDDDYGIKIWNISTGEVSASKHDRNLRYHVVQFMSRDRLVALIDGSRDAGIINGSYSVELWSTDLKKKYSRLTGASPDMYDIYGGPIYSDHDSLTAYRTLTGSVKVVNVFHPADSIEVSRQFEKLLNVAYKSATKDFLITSDNGITIWNSESQTFRKSLSFSRPASNISFDSSFAHAITHITEDKWDFWDIDKKSPANLFRMKKERGFLAGMNSNKPFQAFLSPDAQLIALGNFQGQILLSKSPFNMIDTIIGEFDMGEEGSLVNQIDAVSFSNDNRFIAFSGALDNKVRVYDQSNKKLFIIQQRFGIRNITISNDNILAFLDGRGTIYLYRLKDEPNVLDSLETGFVGVKDGVIKFSSDSRALAFGTGTGMVYLIDWIHKALINKWDIAAGANSLEFINRDSLLIVSNGNANFKILSTRDENPLLSVSIFNSKDWVAYTPDGYFDGTEGAWRLLPMSFSSNPWKLYEPEQFFNVFYQPGLVYEIIHNNKDIKSILLGRGDERGKADISVYLNSKIPELSISPMDHRTTDRHERTLRFNIRDEGSGIRDLKVFRNNMLVYEVDGELKGNSSAKEYTTTIPIKVSYGINTISAYAFNRDNLRSKEASVNLNITDIEQKKGDVHILTIGIDKYAEKKLHLNYAVADAQLFASVLYRQLSALGEYEDFHSYPIYNENATKTKIEDAISAIGGAKNSTAQEFNITPIAPEDVLFIFYSGHGYAVGNSFFFIPADINTSTGTLDMKNAISDEELAGQLRNINCKNIVLVVDACQSGQAIGTSTNRLGPFDNRGLAQLAYEKGIYVIAASQSQQSALEVSTLGHGLLTYTMIVKGLQLSDADYDPKDKKITVIEWLNYSALQVPLEYRTVYDKMVKAKEFGPAGTLPITSQIPKVYFRREHYYDALLIKKI